MEEKEVQKEVVVEEGIDFDIAPCVALTAQPWALHGGLLSVGVPNDRLWVVGEKITVKFLDGELELREEVIKAMNEWSKYANIKFKVVTDSQPAFVRISFSGRGHWSMVGTDCKTVVETQPTMNLQMNYAFFLKHREACRGTIYHEFGHVLGFLHEHQHPDANIPWDAEAVYRYYRAPPNCWDKKTIRHNVLDALPGDTQRAEFDRKSIMLYPILRAHLKRGNDHFATGWNFIISEEDQKFVRRLYPFKGEQREPAQQPQQTDEPGLVAQGLGPVKEVYATRVDHGKVPFVLSADGKHYTTKRGMVLIRNYKGFDPDDLIYTPKAVRSNEELEALVRKDVTVFKRLGKERELRDIEQCLCDAYVNVVEIAKNGLNPADSTRLIDELKQLRYHFFRKVDSLLDFAVQQVPKESADPAGGGKKHKKKGPKKEARKGL